MAAVDMPLTVTTPDGSVDLWITAPVGLRWDAVAGRIAAAAGLDRSVTLHYGAGAIEPGWILGRPPLVAGCTVATAPDDTAHEQPPVVVTAIGGPDAGNSRPLTGGKVSIGRADDVTLPLTDPAVSVRHAVLEADNGRVTVVDCGSTNGVFVDGRPVDGRAEMPFGAHLHVGDTLLQTQVTGAPHGRTVADGCGYLVRAGGATGATAEPPPWPVPPGPPPVRARRGLPIISAVVGAAAGGVLALVIGNPLFLAFAALGPVTMLGQWLADRISGRRSHRTMMGRHRAAVADYRTALAAVRAAHRQLAWQRWPDPATLLRRIRHVSDRLWSDAVGPAPAVAAGWRSRPDPPTVATGGPDRPDGGCTRPEDDQLIDRTPVTVDLVGAHGLVGPVGRARARWMLAQAVGLVAPSRLALVLVDPGPDLADFRLLPHVAGGPGPHRHPSGAGSAAPANSDPPPPGSLPVCGELDALGDRDLLVVLDGPAAVGSAMGVQLLAAAGASAATPGRPASSGGGATVPRPRGVAVLCLVDRASELPPDCRDPMAAPDGGTGTRFVPTGISAGLTRQMVRNLLPLRMAGGSAAPLAAPTGLADLIGPLEVEALTHRWRRAGVRAVLGTGPSGAPVSVDLDVDGPHLLIAGTTGSGKSELLQTLICSLAAANAPSAVTFLLVDYKGGAAFASASRLPHVVGMVTDLSPSLAARALASLRAELRRREHLQAAREPAPARLVIVIDEFATLSVELPEFLAGLLDIAQRGRSLGMHLVVATQRPAGVVSPAMRANISARICLRVTDPADSIDVIGTADASRIPAATPGRALLRTGAGLVGFHTALSSTPVTAPVRIWCGGPDGWVPAADPAPAAAAPGVAISDPPGPPTTISALVDCATAASSHLPAPRRPWLPELPDLVGSDDLPADTVALLDLPDDQDQRPQPLADGGLLVVGAPGSGRTVALRRIALAAAAGGAEICLVDPAGSLADLRDLPQTSTYLTLAEPQLVARLVQLLGDGRRRPTDGRRRYLIIDDVDLVVSALDRVDPLGGAGALHQLPSRSGGTVQLALAAPLPWAHQRIAAAVRTLVTLLPGVEEQPPGRCEWGRHRAQIVYAPAPATTPTVTTGEDPVGTARNPAPGPHRSPWVDATVVRPLPERVARGQLPAPHPERVPLGVGGDRAEPVTIDLTRHAGALLVVGGPRSGVSTAVRTIVMGAADAGIPVVRATIGAGRGWSHPAITNVPCDPGPTPLRELLAAHTGPLLLAVDLGPDGTDHPAAPLFERFCQVAGPGQCLLIGVRSEVLMRSRRGYLATAVGHGRGLLLNPDPGVGALFDRALPRRVDTPPIGRAVWVDRDGVVTVQTAHHRAAPDGRDQRHHHT